MKKKIIISVLLFVIFIGVAIYALFRFEWNEYAIGKDYSIPKVTGAIQIDHTILVTTVNPYLFISKDDGESWQIKMFNLDEGETNFSDLGVKGNTIYFLSRNNSDGDISPQFLYLSDNNDGKWNKKRIADLLPKNNKDISPESFSVENGKFYTIDHNESVHYQSNNFGKTWEKTNALLIKEIKDHKNSLITETTDNAIILKNPNTGNTITKLNKDFAISIWGNVIFR